MKRFQQVLAFPMFATAAWLLWVLSQQADSRTYGAALAGLLLVAMGAAAYLSICCTHLEPHIL